VTIRPATELDRLALLVLVDQCGLRDPLLDYTDYTPPVFVAEDDGAVVGFVQARLGLPATVITDFAVAREYEHRGIGQALVAAVEDTMRAQGLTAWVACVANGRPRVQHMAEQWGALPRAEARTYVKVIGR
jgi:ribosomal protein S18 acetylase RimI-like enzyme